MKTVGPARKTRVSIRPSSASELLTLSRFYAIGNQSIENYGVTGNMQSVAPAGVGVADTRAPLSL